MLDISLQKKINPLKNAARLRKIVGVLASHGFQDVAERAGLGRFVFKRWQAAELENLSPAERLRLAFEKLGPTFVKLGQLLATRPDLIPDAFCKEFQKLHDHVTPLPFEVIEPVLSKYLGANWRGEFKDFDETPIAAASIAQVHQARLKDGAAVVVKIQRPGVYNLILEDLSVMYQLADLAEKYIPETKVYRPKAIVDEFFKTMQFETDFIVEANNIRRFEKNFEKLESIKIPHVHTNLTSRQVLVMEKLEGMPLSQRKALEQPGVDPEEFLKTGLRAYLKMVFGDGLFHGDLHAGNMFVLPDGKMGLIDFGIVGRLNRKSQAAIANMLLALSAEDYDRLAYEYVDLAPYRDVIDIDRLSRDLRDLIAPYYGLTLKHVNTGRLLLDATALAARNGLSLPPELVIFFRSIIALEGIGRWVKADFDFLSYAQEFASDVITLNKESHHFKNQLAQVSRDLNSLALFLPRQIRQTIRRVNSPEFSMNINVPELKLVKGSIEHSSRLLFLGVIISSLILSASFVYVQHPEKDVFGMPWLTVVGFFMAGFLSFAAFINYIRK